MAELLTIEASVVEALKFPVNLIWEINKYMYLPALFLGSCSAESILDSQLFLWLSLLFEDVFVIWEVLRHDRFGGGGSNG